VKPFSNSKLKFPGLLLLRTSAVGSCSQIQLTPDLESIKGNMLAKNGTPADGVRVAALDAQPHPTANEAVQMLLESCGAEVRVAGSAAQALQMLDVWKPDVLISDIAMPDEDGYVLIKKIRARSAEHGGDLPAAALTAYATTEDRVSMLAAGFQMYLSKPADPGELIGVVASLAARPRGAPGANGGS